MTQDKGTSDQGSTIDFVTVAALAAIAYILQNVLHEAVGYGGACLLVGGEPSAVSAAAAFGGTSALAWMAQLLKGETFSPPQVVSQIAIPRNWGWLGTSGVLVLVHIFVLGPSVQF